MRASELAASISASSNRGSTRRSSSLPRLWKSTEDKSLSPAPGVARGLRTKPRGVVAARDFDLNHATDKV